MKRYLLSIIAVSVMSMPVNAVERDSAAATAAPQTVSGTEASPFKFSAVVDMQVEKKLYDEFSSTNNTNRFTQSNFNGVRQAFDDFWMRVALKGTYQLKNLESVFNVRFYPYWTLRRKIYVDPQNGTNPPDLQSYLDVLEVNQAYIKVFKDYSPQDNLTFQPRLKIGRDGLLCNSSQLFGNYLEQPAGGLGDSRIENVVGPFKNRKVFANQMEAGFAFNVFNRVGGATSLMIGGNLSNDKWYNQPATQYWQLLDSKLNAGFFRVYQDLFFLNKRFHLGGGFRNYSAPIDSSGSLVANTTFAAQGAFDAVICKDVKFYTEVAMQKMSSTASTGVVRPINAGITIPTFGVLDTLAVEFENVAKTFLSDQTMRDAVGGRNPTRPLAWGIVAEKRYYNRFLIDWGLYSGNPTGDMKTTLRLTSIF